MAITKKVIMLEFYKSENVYDKSEDYNAVRDIVRKGYPSAELASEEGGYCILWHGVAIGETSDTPYEAWLDVALPY